MLAAFGVEMVQPVVRALAVAVVLIVLIRGLTLTVSILMSVRQIMVIAVPDTAVRIQQDPIPAIRHPVRRMRAVRQAVHAIPVIVVH